jgi:hypothetical protein
MIPSSPHSGLTDREMLVVMSHFKTFQLVPISCFAANKSQLTRPCVKRDTRCVQPG